VSKRVRGGLLFYGLMTMAVVTSPDPTATIVNWLMWIGIATTITFAVAVIVPLIYKAINSND